MRRPHLSRLRHLAFGIALLATTSGCSKIDSLRKERAQSPVPSTPFSIDCELLGAFVGNGSVPLTEATIRLQINPTARYYKLVDYTGSLPPYRDLFERSDMYRNHKQKDISHIFQTPFGWVPFLSPGRSGTMPYRVNEASPERLILEEANDLQLRTQAGDTAQYMILDTRERLLRIGYEWREGLSYREYQQHRGGGPASFTFKCAKSPSGTVIEVDGFNQ